MELAQKQNKNERISENMCTCVVMKNNSNNKYILIFKLTCIIDSIINNNYVKSYEVRVAVDHNVSNINKRMRTR